MLIRQASPSDIASIVGLLKESLGENLMPKSEHYWLWKHVNNHFGPSPVLLAEEGGQIVGVRAFMRWRWMMGQEHVEAVRAVDTATHPAHQGKGIFKKLTLALVDTSRQDGLSFVFNTPNKQSGPGYLKMGWIVAGQLPVSITIRRPFSMLKSTVFGSSLSDESPNGDIEKYVNHPGLQSLVDKHRTGIGEMITDISPSYFKWRYHDVPVVRYTMVVVESAGTLDAAAFGRIKYSKLGKELRLTDIVISDRKVLPEFIDRLNQLAKDTRADYITIAGTQGWLARSLTFGLLRFRRQGPLVTVRSLSRNDMGDLIAFRNWCPSLGDLELF